MAVKTLTIAEYLLERLKELGIKDVFGVPGDFSLGFLDYIEDDKDLNWVGCVNELNAGYAADGYARIHGIAALSTTFGVGELGSCAAVAGSFSELVPVVHIVGVPSTKLQAHGALLHHTLGNSDFRVYERMYQEITVANGMITQENAAETIDRVLTTCVQKVRPVYLSIPTDVVSHKITVDMQPLPLKKKQQCTSEEFEATLEAILQEVEKAKHPVILVDGCVVRHKVIRETTELVERTGLAFFASPFAKGAIDESHPQFRGVYSGETSLPAVIEEFKKADLVLNVGAIRSDFNTGGFSYHVGMNRTIELHSDHTKVFYALYDRVSMHELLPALAKRISPRKCTFDRPILLEKEPGSSTDGITHRYFWPQLSEFMHKDNIILAETGTAVFGALATKFPDGATFVSQILFGSIGYTVGACLGCCKAGEPHGRQIILLVGDGSFQLTAQEVSTMLRYGVKPVIVLLNNGGYTIEKLIHGENRKYNNIHPWQYVKTLEYFGAQEGQAGVQCVVKTRGELEEAMKKAVTQRDKIHFVEVVFMDSMDAPDSLKLQAEKAKVANEY
ncbi:uncharacterized protein VTP21DRAFT_11209 [Calcarisporiella thermophila]|uniref:uncharacterized protein n=1 Tax=Calcarisporiella thermophila TaxID=911321 RepID=UPI003743E6DD